MKAQLLAYGAKFDALPLKEKRLVAGVIVFAVVMLGYTFWVEPAKLGAAKLSREIAQQKAEMQKLQGELAGLASQLKDPNAPVQAALADVRQQLAAADRTLQDYDRILVPAERMPQLLRALFARHRGLELVGLQTLPPAPLLASKADNADTKADARTGAKTAEPAAGKAAETAAKTPGIVKHGIEIKLAGGYLDLLSYVAELEGLPQKLVWSRMELVAATFPRSELTLTLYTLSLNPVWMVM